MAKLETLFVEVLLPLALPKTLCYRVPTSLNEEIAIGKRVVVPFRSSKFFSGIITEITNTPPTEFQAKYIIEVLDLYPIIQEQQLSFWKWISDYYMCSLGEVMNAALPASLKLSGESNIVLNTQIEYDKSILSDDEFLIIDALEVQPILNIAEATKILGKENLIATVNNLVERNIIVMAESVTEKIKPLIKKFIRLSPKFEPAKEKEKLFKQLEPKPKQLNVLLAYSKLNRTQSKISQIELLSESGVSASVLKNLIEKNFFELYEEQVSRLENYEKDESEDIKILSNEQKNCLNTIEQQFEDKDVVLLHGITSSGKTHIFIKLIEKYLSQSKQILYLLPEIALTTQIVYRLQKHFGKKIGVYHSRFNDQEKAEIWRKVQEGSYQIILGARSAIFMPFSNLGLVIIDEEHEPSYKQQDPAPRYHARDVAIYLAHQYHAKTLLGSATPSLESYYHAQHNKYGFATLLNRFGNIQPPSITTANITEETANKTMQSHFCGSLIHEINLTLNKKEQIVLFQNRRGYVPLLICKTCAHTPKCINCDVSLTHHKSSGMLHCHYCGYKQNMINSCPVCGSTYIEQKGFGTEKIEEDLSYIFPDIKIARLDQDATRKKNAFQNIINDFEEQKTNILIGTQMVAKGLDFSNVTLIGIINADALFRFPEFRANERGFQTLTQVAGRAGRRSKLGKVIIQTYQPEHSVIQNVINGNYSDFYLKEIAEREDFVYPPFCRIIQIDIKHQKIEQLIESSDELAKILRGGLANLVLGPVFPVITRIKNLYIKTITLKIQSHLSYQKVKHFVAESIITLQQNKNHRSCVIQIDVDPY